MNLTRSIDSAIQNSMSLNGFKRMMVNIRIVLIQDCAVLSDLYPECVIWKHPLFRSEEFKRYITLKRYKAEVLLVCKNEAETPAQKIQTVLPEVASIISTMNNSIMGELLILDNNINRMEQMGDQHTAGLSELKGSLYSSFVDALCAVQFTPTIAGASVPGTAVANSSGRQTPAAIQPTLGSIAGTATVPTIESHEAPLYTMSRQNVSSIKDLTQNGIRD